MLLLYECCSMYKTYQILHNISKYSITFDHLRGKYHTCHIRPTNVYSVLNNRCMCINLSCGYRYTYLSI